MFIIAKEVHSFNYYWNEFNARWEGLRDNASLMRDNYLDFWKAKIQVTKMFYGAYIIKA